MDIDKKINIFETDVTLINVILGSALFFIGLVWLIGLIIYLKKQKKHKKNCSKKANKEQKEAMKKKINALEEKINNIESSKKTEIKNYKNNELNNSQKQNNALPFEENLNSVNKEVKKITEDGK